MAIQISGTTVVNNSRQLQNIASLDATTTTTISSASSPPTAHAAVGTYTISARASGNNNLTVGSTTAGSGLRYWTFLPGTIQLYSTSNYLISQASGTYSGTWRNMGPGVQRTVSNNYYSLVLFVRTS